MLSEGLVEEVKRIIEKYDKTPTAMQGLGYKEVVKYLNGEMSYEEMKEEIKKGTRHYAKRQITWFKKYDNIIWLDGENDTMVNIDRIKNELLK